MSALKELVRKFRQAVTGVDDEPRQGARTDVFNWEPAPAPPLPSRNGAAVPVEAATHPESPLRWKKAAVEPAAGGVLGASIPADVPDFATVYKGSGVQAPPHGYGVDRVGQMLNHKSLAGLDRSVKASAVLAALDAAGVRIHDVVQDALLRHKALVAFEAAKDLELTSIGPRNEHRIGDLREEIEAFHEKKNAETEALIRESNQALAGVTRLKTRARAEQERFHRAISLFVEPLPARVLPMTPKTPPDDGGPGASKQEPPAPELKLVAPVPAEAKPVPPGPVTAGAPAPPVAKPETSPVTPASTPETTKGAGAEAKKPEEA